MNATKVKRISSTRHRGIPYRRVKSKSKVKRKCKSLCVLNTRIINMGKRKAGCRNIPPQEGKAATTSTSQDSVIYVNTIYPYKKLDNIDTFIDLTQSDSDLLSNPRKRLKLDKIKSKRLNSTKPEKPIITIQSPKRWQANSCEDFGLVQTQNNVIVNTSIYNYYSANGDKVCVQKLNATESSIQLKRTYPFTTVQENADDNKIQEELFDQLVSKINEDLSAIEMTDAEKDIYKMDIDEIADLYQVTSKDNFDT